MPINRWLGQAQPVPAVAQFVPSNVEPGCEYVLTSGLRSVSYRYPAVRPVLDDLQAERQQRVVDELLTLLQADSLGGAADTSALTYESSSLNGAPAIRVTGSSNGRPITLQSSALAPTTNPIRITRLQEGTAGTNYVFTIKFPGTPTGGSWGVTAAGKQPQQVAFNANAATVQAAIAALGLPCNSVTVTGSHSVGYTVTLAGVDYPIEHPPVRVVASSGGATITGVAGYTVEQLGSAGTVNQESFIPALDGNIESLYRFVWNGRQSHWFTGVSTIAEIADAAKALWGAANVQVSAYANDSRYIGVIEFTGSLAAQAVTAQWENEDVVTDLETRTEADSGTYSQLTQRFRLTNGVGGGTFIITDGTNSTAGIAYNASAATILAAMSAATPSVIIGNVVTASANTIEIRSLQGVYLNVGGLTVVGPAVEVTSQGTPDAQEIQLVAIENKPTGGTFTLTAGGNTTTALAYNASAATVQAALEALASIGAGNVTVLGADGGPYRCRFTAFATRALMTANGASLTLANVPAFSRTDIVAGTGPNHLDNAANWSLGRIPIDGDDIVFSDGSVDCSFNIDQSAITPASISIYRSYKRARIGLPEVREDGSRETLNRYLKLGNAADADPPTVINIGLGEDGTGEGPSLVRIDMGTQAFTAFLRYSQVGTETKCVSLLGTAATNKVYVTDGDLALGIYPDESVNISELQLLPSANASDTLAVSSGDGAAITSLIQQGGSTDFANPIGSMLLLGGTSRVRGSGKPNTIEVANANLTWMASGDLGKSGNVTAISISIGVATLTSAAHGLSSGNRVYVRGVSGVVGLDGLTYAVEVLSVDTFKLIGSNCSGAYTGTGIEWGLERAIIVRPGGVLDFDQDSRSRDIVSPVVMQGDAQLLDSRSSISDLRIWPEQVDALSNFGRNVELRRAAR